MTAAKLSSVEDYAIVICFQEAAAVPFPWRYVCCVLWLPSLSPSPDCLLMANSCNVKPFKQFFYARKFAPSKGWD